MDGQQINQQQAIDYVKQTVQQSGVNPEVYVQLGKLAEQVLTDRNLYPQFVNEAVKAGVADKEDFGQQMDYQSLIAMIAMGRVCQQMAGGMA